MLTLPSDIAGIPHEAQLNLWNYSRYMKAWDCKNYPGTINRVDEGFYRDLDHAIPDNYIQPLQIEKDAVLVNLKDIKFSKSAGPD